MSNQTQPTSQNRKSSGARQKRAEASEPETNELEEVPARGPTHEQIARRAYELWLQHGQQHGREKEDWIQAERDLQLGRY